MPEHQEHIRYGAIHRALLAGLLGNVGTRTDQAEYTGARNTRFSIFPGSALFKRNPSWVVAFELVQTTRLYARTAARINPLWIEPLAEHLVKRTHSETRWQSDTAHVVADEKVSLYGLTIVPRRPVHFGPIDPKVSREIFIQCALVEGDYRTSAPFFKHNRDLITELEQLEAKGRRRDLLADAKARFEFYDQRIPAGIHNGPLFEKWRRQAEAKNAQLLFMKREDLLKLDPEDVSRGRFPDSFNVGDASFRLTYQFDPGTELDGVTITLPVSFITQVSPELFQWLVPGLLADKLTALIRSMPKQQRVNFIPAPQFAQLAMQKAPAQPSESLLTFLAGQLTKAAGIPIHARDFDPSTLPDFLRMNFRVVDESGKQLAIGRDLPRLQKLLGAKVQSSLASAPVHGFNRDNITAWDFGDLPDRIELKHQGLTLQGYPSLVDQTTAVSIRLLDTPASAETSHQAGIHRLLKFALQPDLKYLSKNLPGINALCLNYATLGSCSQLKDQLIEAIADRAFSTGLATIRNATAFEEQKIQARHSLFQIATEVTDVAGRVLSEYQTLSRTLSASLPPQRQAAARDLREQLTHLVAPGFLTQIPWAWLQHVPRYLKGMQIRLEKSGPAAARDAQLTAQSAPLWQQLRQRRTAHEAQKIHDLSLEQYRWMLEELRISLFAQELRTSIPISVERLAKQWALVKP